MTCIQRMDSVKEKNKHHTILKVLDELWDKIKNILPKDKPLKTVGRPIIPYRKGIDGIIYVLRTVGCQWKMLPKE
ncbi:MAG TPA: transposase [Verrucomicrobiae bacterium]|nr:transposase [Verrucomicrobiae bacterium]